mgnify:CR=1 FL=1
MVFTLPECINTLVLSQPKVVYKLLFKAAWATVQEFGADPVMLHAVSSPEFLPTGPTGRHPTRRFEEQVCEAVSGN